MNVIEILTKDNAADHGIDPARITASTQPDVLRCTGISTEVGTQSSRLAVFVPTQVKSP